MIAERGGGREHRAMTVWRSPARPEGFRRRRVILLLLVVVTVLAGILPSPAWLNLAARAGVATMTAAAPCHDDARPTITAAMCQALCCPPACVAPEVSPALPVRVELFCPVARLAALRPPFALALDPPPPRRRRV
jgi:hypothetical protein